jgi:NitT/TauT family transport system substrate-binding protein
VLQRCLLLILLQTALVSCSFQEVPLLRIGTNNWPGFEPFYLAREQGWIDSEQIRLVEFSSSVDVMDAIRQRRLEGGALTLDEALLLLASGVDITLVLVCDQSHGADVVMARPNVENLTALRQRKIAVETTAVGALMLDAALQAGNLGIGDVKIVHLEPDEQLNAYLRNEVDAVVTFEPYKSQLQRQGARVLFSSADIPGQIVDVLAIRTDALDNYNQQIAALVSAFFRARQQLVESRPDSMAIINRRLKLTPDELAHVYQGIRLPSISENRQLLEDSRQGLSASAQTLTRLMFRQQLLGENNLPIRTSSRYLPDGGQ